MKNWTVIVDDDCGTARTYYLSAPTPNAAANFAERVFNAHSGIGGKTKYVYAGEVEPAPYQGYQPMEVINLFLIDADHDALEPA